MKCSMRSILPLCLLLIETPNVYGIPAPQSMVVGDPTMATPSPKPHRRSALLGGFLDGLNLGNQGIGAKVGANVNAGGKNLVGVDADADVDLITKRLIELGAGANINAGDADVNVNAKAGIKRLVGLGVDANVNAGGKNSAGLNADADVDLVTKRLIGLGIGANLNAGDDGLGADANVNAKAGIKRLLGLGVDANVDAGVAGVNAGVDVGANLNLGSQNENQMPTSTSGSSSGSVAACISDYSTCLQTQGVENIEECNTEAQTCLSNAETIF